MNFKKKLKLLSIGLIPLTTIVPILTLSSCSTQTGLSVQEVIKNVDDFLDNTPIEELFRVDENSRTDGPKIWLDYNFYKTNWSVLDKRYRDFWFDPGVLYGSGWKDIVHITKKDFESKNYNPLFIDFYDFYDMHNLETIELPDSVIWIGNNLSFKKLVKLKNLPKNLRYFGKQRVKEGKLELDLDPSIELPEHLRFIGDNVFRGTMFRESYMDLPKKLRFIGYEAFRDLKQNPALPFFDKLILPDSLEVMNGAFRGTTIHGRLQRIILPKKLKYLGGDTFNGITMPNQTVDTIVDFTNVDEQNFKTLFPTENIFEKTVSYLDYVSLFLKLNSALPEHYLENSSNDGSLFQMTPYIYMPNIFNGFAQVKFLLPRSQQDRIENPKYVGYQKVNLNKIGLEYLDAPTNK